jgi:hypothetical protein
MEKTPLRLTDRHRKLWARSARMGFWTALLQVVSGLIGLVGFFLLVAMLVIIAKTPA